MIPLYREGPAHPAGPTPETSLLTVAPSATEEVATG
jgi:hypothetical protein